jgi:hypothetical protein
MTEGKYGSKARQKLVKRVIVDPGRKLERLETVRELGVGQEGSLRLVGADAHEGEPKVVR